MSIESWYPVLGWEKLPNFGNCHTIQNLEEFGKSYKETYDIQGFRRNLLENLTGQFEQINIRILGNPGSGKTTFLYSLLKSIAENGSANLLEKYCFYIFHVNRAIGSNSDEIVQENMLLAWEKYFQAVSLEAVFTSIQQQNANKKDKLNRCSDYFKENRSSFSSKVLIIIIDDADLLGQVELRNVACSVIKHVELSSIKKWLVLRGSTYEMYDDEVRKTLDSFFPDLRPFPKLSLHDIISHRISNTSSSVKSKNPFSPALCEGVSKLFDGNLRESLSALQSILGNVSVGELKNTTAEEFIQKYLDSASISSLVKSGYLYNVHAPHLRNIPFPLALDTICLMRFINDPILLLGTVNHAINYRWSRTKSKEAPAEIKLKRDNLDFTLNRFVEFGLAIRKEKSYFLTYKGEALAKYAPRRYYTDTALSNTEQDSLSTTYQLMCYQEPDHQDIAMTWMLYPETH